ncbi:MAG: hypothetical protein K2N06_02130 [Oscillospiraceae bacterium]|nr:hypothetical protein [Oscillospiraceae bacterium]
MKSAIDNPKRYLKQNAERFDDRSIDFSDEDFTDEYEPEELLFLAMVDELDSHGYAFEVDWKCPVEDFVWSFEQMKSYALISDVISHLELNEDDNVETWGKTFNVALGDRARLGYIDIDSDSYVLIITTPEVFAKIGKIAEENGHSIVAFR